MLQTSDSLQFILLMILLVLMLYIVKKIYNLFAFLAEEKAKIQQENAQQLRQNIDKIVDDDSQFSDDYIVSQIRYEENLHKAQIKKQIIAKAIEEEIRHHQKLEKETLQQVIRNVLTAFRLDVYKKVMQSQPKITVRAKKKPVKSQERIDAGLAEDMRKAKEEAQKAREEAQKAKESAEKAQEEQYRQQKSEEDAKQAREQERLRKEKEAKLAQEQQKEAQTKASKEGDESANKSSSASKIAMAKSMSSAKGR